MRLRYLYDGDGICGFRLFRGVSANEGSDDGELYVFEKDLLGNVVEVRNGVSGVVEARYEYDAWGNHKVFARARPGDMGSEEVEIYDSRSGVEVRLRDGVGMPIMRRNVGLENPIRYRGYYFDVESGFYYLKSRYYDARVGRFINADSYEYLEPSNPVGLNLYAYCGNDPVNNVDPEGTRWLRRLLIAVAVAVVVAVVIVATKGAAAPLIAKAGKGLKAAGKVAGKTAKYVGKAKATGKGLKKSIGKAAFKGTTYGVLQGISEGVQEDGSWDWEDFGVGFGSGFAQGAVGGLARGAPMGAIMSGGANLIVQLSRTGTVDPLEFLISSVGGGVGGLGFVPGMMSTIGSGLISMGRKL